MPNSFQNFVSQNAQNQRQRTHRQNVARQTKQLQDLGRGPRDQQFERNSRSASRLSAVVQRVLAIATLIALVAYALGVVGK